MIRSKLVRPALLMAAISLTLGGCYKATYHTGLAGGGPVQEAKVNHFIFGLAGGGDIDTHASCPTGVASVHTEKGFLDLLITGLTGDLWSPTSVAIECATGATATR